MWRSPAVAALTVAAALFAGSTAEAAVQGPAYFYCYAPDASTGTVHMSQTLPVGPVAERAIYGSAFAAYLRSKGLIAGEAQGYCVMRATESEIERGRAELQAECPECAGASSYRLTPWVRGVVAATVPAAAPHVATSRIAAAVPAASPAPDTARVERATLCNPSTSIAANAMRSPCTTAKPRLTARSDPARNASTRPARTTPRTPNPSKAPPMPAAQHQTACAVLTTAGMTKPVIRLAKPKIDVTMSPGTELYMRELVTGATYRLGHGTYTIPTGDYVLGLYGVANGGDPLRHTVQACARYEV